MLMRVLLLCAATVQRAAPCLNPLVPRRVPDGAAMALLSGTVAEVGAWPKWWAWLGAPCWESEGATGGSRGLGLIRCPRTFLGQIIQVQLRARLVLAGAPV